MWPKVREACEQALGSKRRHQDGGKESNGGDEGHEAGATEELGDEDSGVALRFRGVDPLKAWSEDTVFAATLSKNSTSIATHDYKLNISDSSYKRGNEFGSQTQKLEREICVYVSSDGNGGTTTKKVYGDKNA
ncbi:unnamed protein product [Camellia sinensis]